MSCSLQADLDIRVPSTVTVRTIFRGQDFGDLVTKTCYKADWQLVPRSDEHKYVNSVKKPLPQNVVPDAVPFPPLLNHFIMMERQQKGEAVDERPMLPIKSVLRPKLTIETAETEESAA